MTCLYNVVQMYKCFGCKGEKNVKTGVEKCRQRSGIYSRRQYKVSIAYRLLTIPYL